MSLPLLPEVAKPDTDLGVPLSTVPTNGFRKLLPLLLRLDRGVDPPDEEGLSGYSENDDKRYVSLELTLPSILLRLSLDLALLIPPGINLR
jgi:hypothetical protein